jgi:hypothetical protein
MSQAQLYANYITVTLTDLKKETTDLDAITKACQTDTGAGCQGALMKGVSTEQSFLADLQTTTPPDCLKAFDTELRAYLTTGVKSYQDRIQGLQQNDASLIATAASENQDALAHLQQATTLLGNRQC